MLEGRSWRKFTWKLLQLTVLLMAIDIYLGNEREIAWRDLTQGCWLENSSKPNLCRPPKAISDHHLGQYCNLNWMPSSNASGYNTRDICSGYCTALYSQQELASSKAVASAKGRNDLWLITSIQDALEATQKKGCTWQVVCCLCICHIGLLQHIILPPLL